MNENQPQTNLPELSVSELSTALKRTVEDAFSFIRVRGELSGVKVAASGHMYGDLKDENAVLNVVCWRGTMSKLSIKPEDGMEVICTGRISTYPGRSNYQMVIEGMELAGAGALLKLLEERKKKLAAEGLFEASRKKQLPFIPKKIGVITSPTGAVIRDIIHRLRDRFPSHVWLWPVRVQGEGAASEIEAAIKGFDRLESDKKPDLLIVARGGGSLEDLMPFNEEGVVRAAAECSIPIISAVGHETDTTLIDYASDLRAPTPTGAAEMAVPRRDELLAQILDNEKRIVSAIYRLMDHLKERISNLKRGLSDPIRLLEQKQQAFDFLNQKLAAAFEKGILSKKTRLLEISSRIKHPQDRMNEVQQKLSHLSNNLYNARLRRVDAVKDKLQGLGRMLESLSYHKVLDRGYAVVMNSSGKPVSTPKDVSTGEALSIKLKDNKSLDVVAGKGGTKQPKRSKRPEDQGDLF